MSEREMLKDSARLDWMIEQRAYVVSDETCGDGYWLNWVRPDGTMWVQVGEYKTPRQAIDAAIEASNAYREKVIELEREAVEREREACAKVCEERTIAYDGSDNKYSVPKYYKSEMFAAAIRAHSTQDKAQ